MAELSRTQAFQFEQQGLFSRKSSTNILSDPRILEHLRTVAEEAQRSEEDENDEEDEYEFQKRELSEKITSYNKRNQLGAFRVVQKDLNYEGAIRFYYEDGNQELTKAVKLTNKTTVEELLPLLVEKFNLDHSGQYALYIVHEKETKLDEIFLFDSDCPLTIAINALRVPHFVLRQKFRNGHRLDSEASCQDSGNGCNENNGEVVSTSPRTVEFALATSQSFDETVTRSKKFSDASSTSSCNTDLSKSAGRHPRTLSDCSSGVYQPLERRVFLSPQFSDPTVFTEEDVERKENKKPKVTRSKSLKVVASMLKRKKNTKEKQSSSTELSTYQSAPGILKVFGDHVSQGSNYKSVRASTISTSQELVRQALEKYGIQEYDPGEFVLCDVVGHFKSAMSGERIGDNEHVWITEYVRVIHDYEKPLVLQSLWKPAGSRLRRFELRKREEVETSGFFINTAETTDRNSFYSVGSDSEHSSSVSGADSSNNISPETRGKGIGKEIRQGDSEVGLNRTVSSTSAETYPAAPGKLELRQPNNMPFFLLLNGYDVDCDALLYCFEEQVTVFGSSSCLPPIPTPDVQLNAPDILPHHCFAYKKVSIEEDAMETNLDEIRFLIYLEPVDNAVVKINNVQITGRTLVEPGDLVFFGGFYLFMFKDPTQISDKGIKIPILQGIRPYNVLRTSETQTDPIVEYDKNSSVTTNVGVDDRITNAVEFDREQICEPRFSKSVVSLSYNLEDEDHLLEVIMGVMDNETSIFRLTPAYILVMVIEHSAAYFTGLQTRKLLLKVSSALQSVAWEKTKEIGKNAAELGSNGLTMLDGVIQEIKPVVFWMANALEMMHYLQCNLSTYLSCQGPMMGSQESLEAADEELLTVLEEIIMFTFQQTVYHLTKVLYSALPAVLDTNPFQAEDGSSDDEGTSKRPPPAVALVLAIFERTRQVSESFLVHSQITGQLFAYLFFFSNASLFNSLMERGAGGKFYKWTKGVQIRGNLEFIEEWATQSNLSGEFGQYMKKLVAAVDILSTPKVQLMQMEWRTLRNEYPDLNPAQLQQLLGEYQLGGKPKPKGWFPPPEEVELALQTSEVLESFATHPPLLLPTTGFQMDLSVDPEDPVFKSFVERLNSNFGCKDKNAALAHRSSNSDSMLEDGMKRVHSQMQRVSDSEIPRRGSPTEQFEALGMRLERLGSSAHSRFRPSPKVDESENGASQPDMNKAGAPVPQSVTVEDRNSVDSSSGNLMNDDGKDAGLSQKAAVLGNPKTIQIAPRKQSRKEEITVQIIPQAVVSNGHSDHAETVPARARSRTGSRVTVNGQPINVPLETSNNDYYDASILTESDLDSYSDEEGDIEHLSDFGDTFIVKLQKEKTGLGLGLIDGMFTPLETPGIYVRTILPTGPAAKDGRVQVGDRILSVNGKSLIGADYASAMELIRGCGDALSLTLARSDKITISKITASAC